MCDCILGQTVPIKCIIDCYHKQKTCKCGLQYFLKLHVHFITGIQNGGNQNRNKQQVFNLVLIQHEAAAEVIRQR